MDFRRALRTNGSWLMIWQTKIKISPALLILLPILHIAESSAAGADKNHDLVLADNYFASDQCVKYLKEIAPAITRSIMDDTKIMVIDDMLGYVTGKDTLISRYESEERGQLVLAQSMLDARKKIATQKDFSADFTDRDFSPELADAAFDRFERLVKDKSPQGTFIVEGYWKYLDCRGIEAAIGKSPWMDYLSNYVIFSGNRKTSSHIGFFDVAVLGNVTRKNVSTGNRFAEPKPDSSSRFLIIDASFKNTDTESRIPQEGSLFISYNGKEYEYDAVEPITLEGYNIWFRKLNPLITMKTKIVYRIPDEIEGQVYWRPGRNSSDTRLWVGDVKAQ